MTRLSRVTALAVGLVAVVFTAACGGTTPADPPAASPTGSAGPSGAGGLGTAGPTPEPVPAPTGNLDGTLFLLGVGTSAGGIYYLHNDVLTLVISDGSFGFFQSATMSPDGKKLAWILNDGAGGSGQLKVQTYGGGTVVIGPSTINNGYTPQWSADSASVVVNYDSNHFGRLNVTSGVITPITPAGGCCFGVFSPDGAYAVLRNGTSTSIVHADGSGPVPALAPSGQVFNRIQSLSPDGRHVIALLKAPGAPAGDAGRTLAANAIVDTVTGATVPIPDGGTLRSGFYLANGNAVIRTTIGGADRIRLLAPSGAVLDEVAVPAAGADRILLGYAP